MSDETNDTQDIVERLRVYYRSSAVNEAADEIERLRRWIHRTHDTVTQLNQRMEELTAERDEARRALIIVLAGADIATMHRLADERGWKCFKETNK